jgi:hypothetical protein
MDVCLNFPLEGNRAPAPQPYALPLAFCFQRPFYNQCIQAKPRLLPEKYQTGFWFKKISINLALLPKYL